jgi:class 3 adenylate cyclase
MSFYLDRHDVPAGTDDEDIRGLHMKDLEVQKRYGVRYLTYWFDYDRRSAFCLVDAPSAELAQQVHKEAHGLLPGSVIPVEKDVVALFMGRLDDPTRSGRPPGSGFRAIMFTDIEGSTDLTQRVGDEAAFGLLREHDQIVRAALDAHRGTEVKHTGDGIMASFESATDAIRAATAIQRALLDREATDEEGFVRVRIGISAGEPVEHGGDLFGSTVNLAARLCAHAEAGHIVVSNAVRELALGKQLPLREPQAVTLKGFDEPQLCAEVAWRE